MSEPRVPLTRDAIKAIRDLKIAEVKIPEWDGQVVTVQELTAAAKNLYQQKLRSTKQDARGNLISTVRLENSTALLVTMVCIKSRDDRSLLFNESDVEWLGSKSATALERIVEAANRLSGTVPEAVAEAEKNSEPSQSPVSSSASL